MQAGMTLIEETVRYLRSCGISHASIVNWVKSSERPKKHRRQEHFRSVTRTYEQVGSLMSTWFDSPEFLGPNGRPIPLTLVGRKHSIRHLAHVAKVKLNIQSALALMRLSTSVSLSDGKIAANRRVFVVPSFDLIRAALVIPRYLDTIESNFSAHRSGTIKLLERQCSVSSLDTRLIAPILRSIKDQGGSFVDAIDSQIEAARSTKRPSKEISELGLLVFAWTGKSAKARRSGLRAGGRKEKSNLNGKSARN